MTTTKHTPGPWSYIHNGAELDLKGNNGNTLIAVFPTLASVEGIAWHPSEEDSANLSLIAAAPELLEALQTFMPFLEAMVCKDHKKDVEDIAKAKAAIAKATT